MVDPNRIPPRIYLDHHATTPVDRRVLEAMLPYFSESFGNAASVSHAFGTEAREAVAQARSEIADLINAEPSEIVFTSGATEADNLAIKGVLESYTSKGNHVVTVATEHRAVLDTCKALEKRGLATVTYLGVDSRGMLDPDAVARAITPRTVLVSVMYANNEIGVIQRVKDIGRLCREREVLFHTDATQAVGKIPLDVEELNVDLAAFSAHKMYGPKGVGALYVRRRAPRVRLTPLIDGGGHESGLRSGTIPVPLVVGFGKASGLSAEEMVAEAARVGALRDRLERGLSSAIEGLQVNGDRTERLPGNLHVSIEGVDAESLILALPGVAISSGSACSSATIQPSHVLRAIGLKEDLLHNSIRIGLGRSTTAAEVDTVVECMVKAVPRLRGLMASNPGAPPS